MKKRSYISIVLLLLVFSLTACAGNSNTEDANENVENSESEDISQDDLLKFENTDEIDFSNLEYVKSETKRDEKLEEAFSKVYELEKDRDDIRYYYNKIDLNGDENPETFVFLVGMPVCGSGGCSGAIFSSEDEEYEFISKFSLVNNPIIISEEKTNGWNDIIMHVAGGGIESFYARLKHDGENYPSNPSVQPAVESGTVLKGTSIISDDISKNKGIEY